MLHPEGVMAIHTRFCLQNTTRMVWRFFSKAAPWPCKDKTEPLPSQQNYYLFPEVDEWNPPITGYPFSKEKYKHKIEKPVVYLLVIDGFASF